LSNWIRSQNYNPLTETGCRIENTPMMSAHIELGPGPEGHEDCAPARPGCRRAEWGSRGRRVAFLSRAVLRRLLR
jgi:hypothetical protein